MIVNVYGVIVFHLVVWIGAEIFINSRRLLNRMYGRNLHGFAYQAIPTRHEVPGKTLPVNRR